MKKIVALSVLAASLSLVACKKTEEAPVTDANATEMNATADETIADLNATAENIADNAGAMIEDANAMNAAMESNAM